MNMRQTAVTWLAKFSPSKLAPHVGNFPVKQTVTSEKVHSPQIWRSDRG